MSKKLLLGCTGSVAVMEVPEIVQILKSYEDIIELKVVCTPNALRFLDTSTIGVPVLTDGDEWQAWKKEGDPVVHIELRKWADAMVIAPLDANTLAKIANGICDNLLMCVVRAWDMNKPLLFATGMNTMMWEHPVTSKHVEKLKEFNYLQIPCREKKLMCGDIGMGGMAEVSTIVNRVLDVLDIPRRATTASTTCSSRNISDSQQ